MPWDIAEGDELLRQEVHRRHGGQTQGGISTPKGSAEILLFKTSGGRENGYNFDGPRRDGSYHYTGEGRTGDQDFRRAGNRAIRDHGSIGKRLRVFEQTRRSYVRYRGEYVIDAACPYRFDEAPDAEKEMRRVIVFHLWPAGKVGRLDVGHQGARASIKDVELEANNTERFRINRSKPETEGERREAALVRRYAAWLRDRGHESKQRKILLPDRASELKIDLLDVAADEIVEAKGSASRIHIRLALGQILDYSEHAGAMYRAVLLPGRPSPDMIRLLLKYQVACIFEGHEGGFQRIDPDRSEVRASS
ncbi:hypothetical protein [Actinoallomurus sp. NPDC052274]|uniref:hypothetical protein n=1 Tax=Actinoallomurus sp. NPDC052274 TaxID=3155420 RepID=UPI003439298B